MCLSAMEFPHGHHSHTHHDQRNDDEEERREHYPPPPSFHQPPPSFHQPPPSFHQPPPYYGENELEPSPPSSHYYQEPPQPPRPYFQEANYAPLPPSPFQETQVVRTFYHQVGDHSIDYPPPQTQVNHVSLEKIDIHLSFKPRLPYSIHQHAHQSGSTSGIDLYSNFKVYCKAKTDFHLTIRDGKVILAPTNPYDEFQNWFKDEKYSTRVKDSEGCPAFALVNKATGQAIKHSIGEAHPVQLVPYNPDVLDVSILWTESKDLGNGFRAVRMVNNIHLNVDAFGGDMKSGGVHDGTTIGLWKWNEGDNQLWKTIPLETPMEFPHGQHSHTRHDRRNDDEEERREHYPPPPSFHQPPPSFHQPPPYYGDHSIDYPPPKTQVNHVSHEKIEIHLSFKPRLPYSIHQHAHQSGSASGIDLYSNFKVYCKAKTDFHLTIRDGKVILAPTNPYNEFQNWFKDEKYSTRVKDSEGCPAFALVNKATGQAIKHSIGEAHPVQLIPYNPDVLESILWTQSKDLGDGFRAVRMVNNIHLNVDAFGGDAKSGGVHDGTTIGLWKWNEGDNQLWKTIPLETPMEFPHGQHSHTRHDRRNDDEEERREHYPPPPSFHQPPPSFHQPPPYYGDHSIDYPPPKTQVNHVSHEKIEIHLSFKPRLPYSIHQHAHQSGSASGIDLYSNFKVYCKAKTDFHLTIRDGKVILAPTNPYNEFQNWFKDEKYSTRVKDSEGCPAFALVNKATGQAIKHSIGEAHPVQLIPYNPDVLESILWTQSKDLGDGFRAVRMVNNIHLNVDAFGGDAKSGGVHDGTTIGLWKWNEGDNQLWKTIPLETPMEFPHGQHSHTRHDRRNVDEEERREHYPPPPSFHQPPPSFHQPPPYYGDHSIDYPPPKTQVNHVSHEKIEIHLSFKPRLPYSIHQHAHQSGSASGIDLYSNFKVYCKAKTDFHLTIRDGKVILAPTNPYDEFQNWFKDEKYSTRVKDSEGYPAFALVNKATGQAIKHSIGEAHPVQLVPYNPDVLDVSILWTESKDLGNGFRAVRMVNNIHLNVDAFGGDMKSGGVHDGTTIGLWKWNEGDNQLWKTIPLETPMEFPHGQHSHTRHDRRNDDEEERREHYPPPPSFHQPPPSFHQPPPYYGDHSIDYPPPQTQVNHVSLEKIEIHLSFKPRLPYSIHQHAHQSGSAFGIDLCSNFKVYSKAKHDFHLTIRDGKVILAPSNPSDEFQNWFKDEKYSTRVKDSEGCPAFAVVNKATGQAIKHSIGEAHPVQLIPYNPDVLDVSILWTESKDLGDGFRTVRMVNNIHLNVDAFHGDTKSGGVHDGTTIVLWKWNKGDNQLWKIIPA